MALTSKTGISRGTPEEAGPEEGGLVWAEQSTAVSSNSKEGTQKMRVMFASNGETAAISNQTH